MQAPRVKPLLLMLTLGAGVFAIAVASFLLGRKSMSLLPERTLPSATYRQAASSTREAPPNSVIDSENIASFSITELEGQLTDPVFYIMEASGCCGYIAKSEAVIYLGNLYRRGPFDFTETDERAVSLRKFFQTGVLGCSDVVVGFGGDDRKETLALCRSEGAITRVVQGFYDLYPADPVTK